MLLQNGISFFLWPVIFHCRPSQVVLVVKNPLSNAEDVRYIDSIPGSGRSPRGGHSNPFQYSCLENPVEEEPGRLQSIGSQTAGHD